MSSKISTRLAAGLAAAMLLSATAGANIYFGLGRAVADKSVNLIEQSAPAPAPVIALSGTAAAGSALSLAPLTVEDCAMKTTTAATAADGSFSVGVAGLTFPMFLRVRGAANEYGIAFAVGSTDVDPYTDLVLRTYYSARGVSNLDASFTGSFASLCGPPTQAALAPLTALIMNSVAVPMARNGLATASFNPFTAPFAADGSGFDAVLDQTSIAANAGYSLVTITDLNTSTVLSSIAPVAGGGVPAPPTGLVFPAISTSSIALSWTASVSSNTAGYSIARNGVFLTAVTGTSFSDAALTPGTTYTYAVSAVNWLGMASAPATQTVGTMVPLTVRLPPSGAGSGTVVSSPAGINCPTACSADFNYGSTVTLTATANAGSTFTGWSGACSGTSACVVTTSGTTSVTVNFASSAATLTVAEIGTGTGNVRSSPAGIDCAPTCAAGFSPNSKVVLTATAGAGSVFAGWSGAGCSGTGTCSVTLSAAQSVVAVFNASAGGGGGAPVNPIPFYSQVILPDVVYEVANAGFVSMGADNGFGGCFETLQSCTCTTNGGSGGVQFASLSGTCSSNTSYAVNTPGFQGGTVTGTINATCSYQSSDAFCDLNYVEADTFSLNFYNVAPPIPDMTIVAGLSGTYNETDYALSDTSISTLQGANFGTGGLSFAAPPPYASVQPPESCGVTFSFDEVADTLNGSVCGLTLPGQSNAVARRRSGSRPSRRAPR